MLHKKLLYVVVCEEWNDEGIVCPCYGLVCGEFRIHYISTDRVFVEKLAALLNLLQPDPARVPDIIEPLLP